MVKYSWRLSRLILSFVKRINSHGFVTVYHEKINYYFFYFCTKKLQMLLKQYISWLILLRYLFLLIIKGPTLTKGMVFRQCKPIYPATECLFWININYTLLYLTSRIVNSWTRAFSCKNRSHLAYRRHL